MSNPIQGAFSAKGKIATLKRAQRIARSYGITSIKMDRALQLYSEILRQYDCGATFPITAITLKRHRDTIANYLDQNIEFAVHGYTHTDYSHLAPDVQSSHLQLARQVFSEAGIIPVGFRSPYLSHDDNLYTRIKVAGFTYVSNQPFLWDSLGTDVLDPFTSSSYNRALVFYKPWRASGRPSLPRLDNQLVEIPVSLPDDEILLERFASSNSSVEKVWRQILSQSYQLGELFTLQLHPERIVLCAAGLSAVLSEARSCKPAVWCARLDEIAAWWKARLRATFEVKKAEDGKYHFIIDGPSGTTVLVRGVDIDVSSQPWVDGYRQLEAKCFTIRAPMRPLIGISPSTSIELVQFLRQQGYIVEISQESALYACYFDQVSFDGSQERTVLDHIEVSGCPLVRLGRWPNGARSALCVTGDIDALTLWDYGFRLIGK